MANNKEHIIVKFQQEEKRSKKRMLIYISVPLILTLILIIVSYYTVDNATKRVQELEIQKQNLEATIDNLNSEMSLKNDSLAEMKKVMELAITYKDKRFEFDFSRDKELFSVYPKQSQLISEMRRMIDNNEVKWHLGGNSPETGFDSPSFAAYMINKFSRTEVPPGDRYKLKEILPATSQPEVGDIVFYEHGYAMFYFKYRNQPFVVGMTPIGLTSLTFEFGPQRIGFGKVKY